LPTKERGLGNSDDRDPEGVWKGLRPSWGEPVLDRKESVGSIGPNGSGKTTLLNVISGIYAPEASSVTLDSADITGMSPNKVARHGIARTSPDHILLDEPAAGMDETKSDDLLKKISTGSVPRAGEPSSPFPPS